MADNLNLSSNIDIQEAWTVVQHFVKKNSFDLDILKPIHKIIDEAKDLDETRAATTKKLNAEKVAADLKKAKFEADLAAAHEARRRFHRYDPNISTPQGCHRLKSGHLSHIRGFAKYYYSNVTRCTTCHREGRGRPDTHEKERVICY